MRTYKKHYKAKFHSRTKDRQFYCEQILDNFALIEAANAASAILDKRNEFAWHCAACNSKILLNISKIGYRDLLCDNCKPQQSEIIILLLKQYQLLRMYLIGKLYKNFGHYHDPNTKSSSSFELALLSMASSTNDK